MTWTASEAERVKALEVKIEVLTAEVESTNKKLDELLALKNKGMGAFWFASILFGAAFTAVMKWFTG